MAAVQPGSGPFPGTEKHCMPLRQIGRSINYFILRSKYGPSVLQYLQERLTPSSTCLHNSVRIQAPLKSCMRNNKRCANIVTDKGAQGCSLDKSKRIAKHFYYEHNIRLHGVQSFLSIPYKYTPSYKNSNTFGDLLMCQNSIYFSSRGDVWPS